MISKESIDFMNIALLDMWSVLVLQSVGEPDMFQVWGSH